MTQQTLKQVLEEARDILNGADWYHGNNPSDGCKCAYTAIAQAEDNVCSASLRTARFFAEANDIADDGYLNGVPNWNDAPGRTKEEVLEAFDKAIAAADKVEGEAQ